jgi:glucokinase
MSKTDEYEFPALQEAIIPLDFGTNKNPIQANGTVLAGDIGGTKTILALYEFKHGRPKLLAQKKYKTKDYTSLLAMIDSFREEGILKFQQVCLGVAGPIANGKVHGTNFPWEIDREELRRELHLNSIVLINDMEANAFGLAALRETDLINLKSGSKISGNAAIISPGTGLGEAGLFWDGYEYHPFATEGGHCDFSPRSEYDLEIWEYFHQKYGHVSWERLLSGQGIHDTYQLLRNVSGEKEPKWFSDKMKKEDPAAVITHTAIEKQDLVCRDTLDMFVRFLAMEAAQLALKFKATGGIYIGGGIVPKIFQGMNKETFTDNFIQSGRMNPLLQMIPVQIVMKEKTALLGAAYYGAMRL